MDRERPLTFLERLGARGHWGIKRGLDNPRALMEALDHPERAYPAVLIAGTNGKGSTGALLASALRACGLKVGWTTSPHLVSPCERIWIDGSILEEARLDELLGKAFEAEERLGITATYFELMIAAAFQGFREARVDLALVEVGLGGRWDATNTLDPVVTALTSVGLDHQAFLGNTRESVAREKLCTARTGRPLVLAPGLDPAWIRPLLECDPVLHPAPELRAERLDWDRSIVQGHAIGLGGAHQVLNLSTAWEVLRQLRELGFAVDEARAWEGLAAARWPGRLWAVPGLQGVWMDGAHNPQGAQALAAHAQACGMRPHLFFGAMADKDMAGVAQALEGIRPLSLTLLAGEDPRYAGPEQLRSIWGEAPLLDIPGAVERLRRPCPEPRLVTGSLFLLGDLLRHLGLRPQL